ncbi:MAG TPA: gluconate 2-dehydrogenase subunit 3 family protein [Opitutaceae bacterium]|nr:gluconate 2-dehydrogenase subunit 3 family protein [Opitutaceae bacterium]
MPPSSRPFPAATLRALLDRMVPPDDFPGAVEAGVEDYVHRQLAGDCSREAGALTSGLRQLDAEAAARHSVNFDALSPANQDTLLRDLEAGLVSPTWPAEISPLTFFARMVELAHEGYYADPANGGNRDGSSWRMIGYDPRLPPPPLPTEAIPAPPSSRSP